MATNGWTGGQYSLYRVIFGTCLVARSAVLLQRGGELFSPGLGEPAALLRWLPNPLGIADGPFAIAIYLAAGVVLALYLTVGRYDRPAAAGLLLYLGLCLAARNPASVSVGDALLGGLLLAHLFVPAAPYGSWAARGRPATRAGALGRATAPAPDRPSEGRYRATEGITRTNSR